MKISDISLNISSVLSLQSYPGSTLARLDALLESSDLNALDPAPAMAIAELCIMLGIDSYHQLRQRQTMVKSKQLRDPRGANWASI